MAYTLTLTNGTTLTTVADGTTDTTTTSVTLVGKNFAGYGQFLNENYVKMLENFSNTTQPNAPLQGQLWWNSISKVLNVYNGTGWKTVSSSASSATAPANPVQGDLWYDNVNGQLKVFSGSTWIVVGPAFTTGTGTSGPVTTVITGTDAFSHVVVEFFVNNILCAILSKDAPFSPATPLTGFTVVNPGFNLAAIAPALEYWGNAQNALALGGVPAANYVRSDVVTPMTSANIATNAGMTIGTAGQFVANVNAATNDINIINTYNGAKINLITTFGNVETIGLTLNGTTGLVTVTADPTANLGIATKQYVDNSIAGPSSSALSRLGSNQIAGVITPDANNTRNFGSAGLAFASIYATNFVGTSSSAKYADLAERFEADAAYAPGTVVELGGDAEITESLNDLSENVFGVISTRAAYLMNATAGDDITHPPVAIEGRVPVRVVGPIKKGDRLVSAGNGLARAATRSEITPWNVIGRALQDKFTSGEGTIEAIVRLNS